MLIFFLSIQIVIHEKPPSTDISAPVTKLDASEANQNMAPNNSFGFPKRSMGVCLRIANSRSLLMEFLKNSFYSFNF